MKKLFSNLKDFSHEQPKAKAITQLLNAFSNSYKPVPDEELADELFTVRRIREYFNAWPIPKMPDPLPPYLEELEKQGFLMQTSYDGSPCIFCIRSRGTGQPVYIEELGEEKEPKNKTVSSEELISHCMAEQDKAENGGNNDSCTLEENEIGREE